MNLQYRAEDGLSIVRRARAWLWGKLGGLMEPFIGQIIPVGFNFAPVGWLLCQGQLVSISLYSTLFQLLGTTYGGDGNVEFGIPDLRGRIPLHVGQGVPAGQYSNYTLGQTIGTENVTLLSTQMGAHSHPFMVSPHAANAIAPANTTALGVAETGTGNNIFVYGPPPSTTNLSSKSVSITGGSNPHENRQPFTAVNFIIAWAGIYPPQS